MSNYYHGAKASKQATSVSTPVVADSSIHLIVGTAPVSYTHLDVYKRQKLQD